jgi:hypothetical protein
MALTRPLLAIHIMSLETDRAAGCLTALDDYHAHHGSGCLYNHMPGDYGKIRRVGRIIGLMKNKPVVNFMSARHNPGLIPPLSHGLFQA